MANFKSAVCDHATAPVQLGSKTELLLSSQGDADTGKRNQRISLFALK